MKTRYDDKSVKTFKKMVLKPNLTCLYFPIEILMIKL
jgi:hypothetical protein